MEEIKRDQDELKRLIQLANRVNVRSLLQTHIDEMEKSLHEAKKQAAPPSDSEAAGDSPVSAAPQTTSVRRPLKKITNYAWDQSDLYVKVYASNLPGVQRLPEENITCDFNQMGFNLLVTGLDGKDYQFQIVSLYDRIVPEQSKIKVKTDSVLVMLKKTSKDKWEGMTEIDRKKKEKQKTESSPKADEDPSAGIMNLMKKMYDDGDDDMKRTIAKAWTESQDKKAAGGGPGTF